MVEVDSAPCRVVVVDDHAMVRDSIGIALGRAPGLEVVGSAASVREGREMVRELRPDVAVLDYGLPDGTGVELARSIHDEDPSVRTLILTANDGVEAAAEAVSAGCAGFLRKSDALGDLADGVLRVKDGEAIFDAQTLSAAIGWLNRGTAAPAGISDRELDVLRGLAEGLTTASISDHLYLSHHTVRNHVRNILAKLDAHSQLEAVVIAASMGLVSVGPGERRMG